LGVASPLRGGYNRASINADMEGRIDMKKVFFASLAAFLFAAAALAHDPRTVAKDFSHTLTVEGAGKLTLSYKSLHWNEAVYAQTKSNDQLRTRLNLGVWRKIGKLDADFDVVIGGTPVPKGSYDMGIKFGANDDFALLLRAGGKDLTIPLKTTADSPEVTYLSFDLRPTSDTDSFLLEGRSGKFRCSAEVKVPYLAPHEHAADGTAKPPDKKP
jgi:hypothetical protein